MPVFPIGASLTDGSDAVDTIQSLFYPDSEQKTGGGVAQQIFINKSFQRNRHTIADVLAWMENVYGNRFWFAPTYDPQSLTMMEYNGAGRQAYQGHNVDSSLDVRPDVTVLENNALQEIRPVNTVIVNGTAAETLFEVADHEVNLATDKYVGAKARHTELYKAAGKTEVYAQPDYSSQANTKTEVQNEAKSILKRAIEQSSTGGDITTKFAPDIQPFDTIYAKQFCDADTVEQYEVNEVHHKIRTDGRNETEMQVSYPSNFTEMEVVDTWKKSVKN